MDRFHVTGLFLYPLKASEEEAATEVVLQKKMLLKMSQNSWENICAIVFFSVNFAKSLVTTFLQNTDVLLH